MVAISRRFLRLLQESEIKAGPDPASVRHPENHPAAGWRPRVHDIIIRVSPLHGLPLEDVPWRLAL